MDVTRTSIVLPTALFHRLQLSTQQNKQSLSLLFKTLAEQYVQMEEVRRRKAIYQAFRQVQGIGTDPVTDASSTIDRVLYGGHDATRQ